MLDTSPAVTALTPAELKRRYEDMCADPRSHTAAAWDTMAELLEGAAVVRAGVSLSDRAADCRARANRIRILRRTFSSAAGEVA